MTVDPSARTEAGEALAPASTELVPGAAVGKYRLDRVLGSGGMGVVWAAFDPDLERSVAIKVLRSVDSGAGLRTRLLREARAMARLKHPNVLTVYEVGTDRNRDYIAMELIDGADLDRWLTGKPPSDDVFVALLAAGRGLAAAHDAGLIHRDLKPHNILRGLDGGVYVTDFGLARGQIEDGIELEQTAPPLPFAATVAASGAPVRTPDSVLDSPLTQTGMLIGTPAYMAPEQFIGRVPDPRSDQFAFCVTAWEALTGARPFTGKNLDELRAAAGIARVPSDVAGVLPPPVRAVLARGLASAPAERWPDMHTLLRELETALAPPVPARSRWLRAKTSAPIAIAVIAAVFLFFRPHDGRPASGAAAADDNECASGKAAFTDTMAKAHRMLSSVKHPSAVQAYAVPGLLDKLREEWLALHDQACGTKNADSRDAQLGCLHEVRDNLEELVSDAEDDSEISINALVPMTVQLETCKHEH